jgi:hypothetical protein
MMRLRLGRVEPRSAFGVKSIVQAIAPRDRGERNRALLRLYPT